MLDANLTLNTAPNWFVEMLESKLREVCPPAVELLQQGALNFWWYEFRENLPPANHNVNMGLHAYIDQLAEFLRRKYIDRIKDRLENTRYE